MFPGVKLDYCVLPVRHFRPDHIRHLQSDRRLHQDVQTRDQPAHRRPGGDRGEKPER